MSVLNIDLWKCYIAYVKQTKATLQTYRCVCKGQRLSLWSQHSLFIIFDCREKLRQTYEFALDHVGIDFHSGSVWLDFIAFIKEE